jgi:LuxR family maltose regulon positive regulatory protein
MTMTFSLHENFEFNGVDIYNEGASTSLNGQHSFSDEIRLFSAKMQIPKFKNFVKRPRLIEVLEKSSAQFGATLVTGRAGTGKTALATEYARKYKCVAWLSIDSADSNWKIFSAYFSACLEGESKNGKTEKTLSRNSVPGESELKRLVEDMLERFCSSVTNTPNLIVLDDAHYIYDSEWFGAFFNSLLYSLPRETHLLVLSRGAPSLPLWRLRSKQVLGVIDEKMLAFDIDETRKLFRQLKCSPEMISQAHSKSFGRISQLKSLAESL